MCDIENRPRCQVVRGLCNQPHRGTYGLCGANGGCPAAIEYAKRQINYKTYIDNASGSSITIAWEARKEGYTTILETHNITITEGAISRD